MRFHISTIEGNYSSELRRLFVFAHLCLPLFSCLSMLTGGYFLAYKILPGILPAISPSLWVILALVMVTFLETIKYFVSPLVTKSLWHKDFLMTLVLTPLVVLLFGTSIYFSVQGVQEFYKEQDSSSEEIQATYSALLDATEQYYSRKLGEVDSTLSALEGKLGDSQILARVDRINQRIRQAEERHRAASNDSLRAVYSRRIKDLQSEKRLVENSTGNSAFQVNKMNILIAERNRLLEEKAFKSKQLRETQAQELSVQQAESNFLQANILYLSLGIELLIALSLSYIQYYRLKSQASHDTKAGDESLENDTSEMALPPNDTYPSPLNGTSIPPTAIPLSSTHVAQEAGSIEKKKPSTNGVSKKRLSETDKEMIIHRFSDYEGNVEELVQELINTYGISRRTVYRYKQKAEQNGLKRLP